LVVSETSISNYYILGWANSSVMTALLELQANDGKFMSGLVKSLPWRSPDEETVSVFEAKTRRMLRVLIKADSFNETSPYFAGIRAEPSLRETTAWHHDNARLSEAEVAEVDASWNEYVTGLYELSDSSIERLRSEIGLAGSEAADSDGSDPGEDEEARGEARGGRDISEAVVSFCVGVIYGRWDVRLVTGEKPPASVPEPFVALSGRPVAMLESEEGLLLAEGGISNTGAESRWRYPVDVRWNGILVDDPGHPMDIEARVREVLVAIWKDAAAAIEDEACEILGVRSLREYFRRSAGFFAFHLKQYSRSRRKAPIYWQLATPSASYSVWLYAHRIGRDSLYQVLNDFVSPKLQAEARKLHALIDEAGPTPSSSQRKEIAAQESFVSELRVLRDEVARVAPLWNPDLNDGVVIVTAPLWRLVPQLKSWQKELKSHWDGLCAGKYDWAQLAMHFWPERVVNKCAKDRSLAIAHDLEDVFWEQDEDGKWTVREAPTRPVAELVAERSSPAVQDALESLLSAPTGEIAA
jgi:hypothetical protein